MHPLSSRLLRWYRAHGRALPWRGHPDAYAVWVSEIMLQQTRVEAVIPYFEKWMTRFSTIKSLADASEQEVLTLWEGLGYYSRARNIHKAARVIVDELDGQLPREVSALRKLPGIGRYTAAAIASMAFGLDEPTLDANIRRVFARLFNVKIPADSAEGEKLLWKLAADNLPKGKAGDFNQALMDLGATICLPKNPRCETCPLKKSCQAFSLGLQESLPILKPKAEIPHKMQAAAVIVGRIDNPPKTAALLAQRPSKGLLANMWEFPNGQVRGNPARALPKALKTGYDLDVLLLSSQAKLILNANTANLRIPPIDQKEFAKFAHSRNSRSKTNNDSPLTTIHHAYTHFRVTVHAFQCELLSKPKNKSLKWVKISELEKYPMGKIDRQIAQKIKQSAEICNGQE